MPGTPIPSPETPISLNEFGPEDALQFIDNVKEFIDSCLQNLEVPIGLVAGFATGILAVKQYGKIKGGLVLASLEAIAAVSAEALGYHEIAVGISTSIAPALLAACFINPKEDFQQNSGPSKNRYY